MIDEPAERAKLLSYASKLHKRGLPILFSLKHLALYAEVYYSDLRSVVKRPGDWYRYFSIRKKSGGQRKISVPKPFLRRTQRWILKNILNVLPCSECATAYCKGGGPTINAEFHTSSRWLIKLDILEFFHSTPVSKVYHFFRSLGYTRLLSFEIAQICSVDLDYDELPLSLLLLDAPRRVKNYSIEAYSSASSDYRCLPQGAPTSPALSNLTNIEADLRLVSIARHYNLRVTRYADDITFSGLELDRTIASEVIAKAGKVLRSHGYLLNHLKTRIVPPGSRRVATGLLVDRERPALTRTFREEIRRHLYYSIKFGVKDHCSKIGFSSSLSFRDYLWGKIGFANSVDSKFGGECKRKFNQIDWGLLAELPMQAKRRK